MKIVVISDIHANYDARRALPEDYDELWVLGDLVNYGPEPGKVVSEVSIRASLVVQGNHDYASDTKMIPSGRRRIELLPKLLAGSHLLCWVTPRKYYLRNLPRHIATERCGRRFYLTHAMPSNPLYGRCAIDGEQWAEEIEATSADFLLVGHTHIPFIRRIGEKTLLN